MYGRMPSSSRGSLQVPGVGSVMVWGVTKESLCRGDFIVLSLLTCPSFVGLLVSSIFCDYHL